MDRRFVAFLAGAALLSAPFARAVAQPDVQYRPSNAPAIFAQAVVFASDQPGQSRADIYVQVPHNELTFVSDNGEYQARFDLTVEINAADGQQVWQKSETVEIRAKTFSQTVSNRLSNLRQLSTVLAPGKYDVAIQVTDAESKRVEKVKRKIVARAFARDSLAVSDILLVSKVTKTDNRTSIVPNVSGLLLPKSESFYIYFEVYRHRAADSAAIIYQIVGPGVDTLARHVRIESLAGPVSQFVWKVDSLELGAGQYRVSVQVGPTDHRDTTARWTSASCPFTVNWESLPISIRDIDKATDQLRYIAKEEDMEYIRAGKNVEERRQRFKEFWDKRNPEPRMPRNELMEEYYARVAYANEHFTHFTDGWRSDMGMVYIRFGPPENIERHPFESDSRPYEIWYYYQLNRQFIFVDRSGFGDYRLNYPDTDLWGRIR